MTNPIDQEQARILQEMLHLTELVEHGIVTEDERHAVIDAIRIKLGLPPLYISLMEAFPAPKPAGKVFGDR